MDTALMAPIRGWVQTSRATARGARRDPGPRLAGGHQELRAADDGRRAAPPANGRAEPIAVGSTCNPAAAAIGRVAEAHAVILAGDVRRGLDLVEEAAVATISGELDAISTGMVYCELVCMLQGLAQYDLAEEWTEAMERWRHGSGIGSVHGRCRVHRAEILRLRGAFADGGAGGPGSMCGAATVPASGIRLAPHRIGPHHDSSWVISTARRRRSSRLAKRGGIRSRDSPCCDWLRATLRWRRHPSATRSTIP